MSQAPLSQTSGTATAVQPANRGVTAKRGAFVSGYSLLARGEPQIWFTGGMLVICLAMIAGLLFYILFAGLPTFWPRPVQWLALNNGTFEIGQYQYSEFAQVSPADADETSPTEANRASPSSDTPPQLNRYYRTGNFDITGRHYRWLTSDELDAGGITEPQWAMVIERLENGRLYGLLSAISLASDVGSDTRQLIVAIQELRSLIESLPELEPAVLSQVVEAIDAQRAVYLDRAFRQAITAEQKAGGLPQVQTAGQEQWLAFSGIDSEQLVTDARRIFTDEKSVYGQLTFELHRSALLRRQAEQLRYRISRLDEHLSELNAQVRRAELETNTPIAQSLESAHYLLEQIEALTARQAGLEARKQLLEQVSVDRDWRPVVLEKFGQYVNQTLPSEIESVEQQLKSWMSPIAEQPQPLVRAVEQYLAGYRQIVKDKSPWLQQLSELDQRLALAKVTLVVPAVTQAADVQQKLQNIDVMCAEIVRAFPANQLNFWDKTIIYLDRWREFLSENPREANTEGGVFPAIWGTIVMTLIMTIAVVPFGVMAALYLREYTKTGPLVSIIRISINNLAGVPSIVYGVFGFSFFCYTIGAFIDGGPRNADIQPWPSAVWYLVLSGVAVTGSCAFFASLMGGGPSHARSRSKWWAARLALLLWLTSVAVMAALILKSPFFEGFYREYLPNPTFGKGGLLWAALTLSLLTLPVVIVATEEALAAVPNSLREGSLACGASKWQTIYRIVLPHAQPGILTGAILAMARGAGEVAPLMLVGALASAPDLPLDGEFPYFHGSRSFMHLGYQIYTLGFQSQNSEAARPMVFTCTLLLILIVAVLNITAIILRSRLKRQFQGSQF